MLQIKNCVPKINKVSSIINQNDDCHNKENINENIKKKNNIINKGKSTREFGRDITIKTNNENYDSFKNNKKVNFI